jgi:ankyrin repeat protein
MENLTKEKNATSNNLSDQNVRYIILQYPNSNEEFDFSGTSNGGGVVNHTNGTVLHLALYGEKWAVVEKILDEWDGDINTTNSLGETPLHLATKLKCRNQLFDKLLSKANSEIEVDLVDVCGSTPLHWALSERSPSKFKIKMYLEKSANLNQTDSNGNIPVDLFNLILDKTSRDNEHNRTALFCALNSKSKIATKKLLKGYKGE